MSTSLSKFGFSTTDNIAGPPGPRGLPGLDGKNGIDGINGIDGKDGQDAIFPLDINGESIIGISSLSGAPNPIIVGAIDPIKINSSLDFMGTVIMNLSEISGAVVGEPIVIHSQVAINTLSTESKFIRADDNKILISSDINIQDVNSLNNKLLLIDDRLASYALTNTGPLFGLPNTYASLVHSTSANPNFKIKGLTCSNNILLISSLDTVDIKIDPLLTDRIVALEDKKIESVTRSIITTITNANITIQPYCIFHKIGSMVHLSIGRMSFQLTVTTTSILLLPSIAEEYRPLEYLPIPAIRYHTVTFIINNVPRECILSVSAGGLSLMDQQDGSGPYNFPINQFIRCGGFTFSYSI